MLIYRNGWNGISINLDIWWSFCTTTQKYFANNGHIFCRFRSDHWLNRYSLHKLQKIRKHSFSHIRTHGSVQGLLVCNGFSILTKGGRDSLERAVSEFFLSFSRIYKENILRFMSYQNASKIFLSWSDYRSFLN